MDKVKKSLQPTPQEIAADQMLAEAEAEARYQVEQAKKYREAWEAEKRSSQAYLEGWRTAERQRKEASRQGFMAGALLGAATGALLVILVTVLTKGWVFS